MSDSPYRNNDAQEIVRLQNKILRQVARIEELEAQNKRLETEAQLQAEEIDKTRRRADKWQSMVLDCEEYLKPGEAPAERIQREINDCLALMKLLEKKQKRIEELEAEIKRLRAALDWAYTGNGLDECTLGAQRIIRPLRADPQPDHSVQVAVRAIVNKIRARAAL